MKSVKSISLLLAGLLVTGLGFSACSLDENDPGGFTFENMSKTVDGYETVLNNIYFGMERSMYGNRNKADFMCLTEAETDLWTTPRNKTNTSENYFWWFAGGSPNTTYLLNLLYSLYDGIGSCNQALRLIDLPDYKTDEERNAKAAEAHFMRAMYYYHGVEQFGGLTVVDEYDTEIDSTAYYPERTAPRQIYDEMILPDLEYAVEWLPVSDDTRMTRPSKKSALGLLARCYLQATRWIDSEADKLPYYRKALECSKALIDDCENGGSLYNTYMYPSFAEVFDTLNNMTNREALWKHAYYADDSYNGSSNNAYVLSQCHLYFRCQVTAIGARNTTAESYTSYEGSVNGVFMPTWHLINLFVQDDGTLDPRFEQLFQNEWIANNNLTMRNAALNMWDKNTAKISSKKINVGDIAIHFVMPQDADRDEWLKCRDTIPTIVADYADVYDDANHTVVMTHKYRNPSDEYPAEGNEGDNVFSNFYPSLTKYNTTNFWVGDAEKLRFGNRSAMLLIRMPEMYLIAAEAELGANQDGAKAMEYVNKVRARAGAKSLSGSATIRTILDERGRELCGEFQRYYDLARTGMFKDATYLEETNPTLAQFWNADYILRPFDTSTFLPSINNGADYQNPGYATGLE